MDKQTIGFIGAGKVGTALAVALSKCRYPVIAVADTNRGAAEKLSDLVLDCQVFEDAREVADTAEYVFITTPDDFIATVASVISWRSNHKVIHCSGAASIDILESAERSGANVGSFHPCQAFANVEQAIDNLPGSTFAIEAQTPLLDTLKDMASSIGCDWIVLKPGDKALYHAAAVFVSNYAVALLKVATDLFQHFDVTIPQATKVLMPLIQGNINNMKNIGLPHCLTGPIARGDISTVQKHIASLKKMEPSLLTLYGALGLQTIPIALAKGTIDEKGGETLQALLNTAIPEKSEDTARLSE
jgi:predicted short-subunit dehydrogenase-like oxidoreductase (DUF2520 family)